MKKRLRYRGYRSGFLVRIRRGVSNPPLPSVLLANVQSLDNKMDDLRSRLSYQRDIKNCNILCSTELWLNDDMDNIQLPGFSVHRQDRTAASGKTRGGGLCIFVNNSWCAKSNIKEVSRFCSPEVEYLMISCRPHYSPGEFIYIFVVVHLPPQTDVGTKTALNELYKAIRKQENAHPEVAFLEAGDLTAGKLKSDLISTSMLHVQPEGKNTRPALLHTQRRVQSSALALHLANLTINYPAYKRTCKYQ